jgi:hypothetical protein
MFLDNADSMSLDFDERRPSVTLHQARIGSGNFAIDEKKHLLVMCSVLDVR